MMAKAKPAPAETSLADDLRRLEEIVRKLEQEEADLDEALALFEEGVTRLRHARDRLAQAEAVVEGVIERADGTLRADRIDG